MVWTPSLNTSCEFVRYADAANVGEALQAATYQPLARARMGRVGPQMLTATAGRLLIATSPDAIMSNTANTNIKPLNPIGK